MAKYVSIKAQRAAAGEVGMTELGRLFHCGRTTLRRWASYGAPIHKCGSKSFANPAALAAWRQNDFPLSSAKRRWGSRPISERDSRPGMVYALIDPRDGLPCYVGQTLQGEGRIRDHKRDLGKGGHPNYKLATLWREITGVGMELGVRTLEKCEAKDLNAAEIGWILHGRSNGWPLCNMAPGGVGPPHCDAVHRQIAKVAKKNWSDPAYQARHEMSRARRMGITLEQYREWRGLSEYERERRRRHPHVPTAVARLHVLGKALGGLMGRVSACAKYGFDYWLATPDEQACRRKAVAYQNRSTAQQAKWAGRTEAERLTHRRHTQEAMVKWHERRSHAA